MRKKSSEEKKASGTYRADRDKGLKHFEKGIPDTPEHLNDEEKKVFEKIAEIVNEMKILSTADAMGLEMLAVTYCAWKKAEKTIRDEGTTFISMGREGNQMHRVRPEVKIADENFKRLKGLLLEFGLTPVSRGKMDLTYDDFEDDLAMALRYQ